MRILIATGGTGGHIFPALKVAQVLKERGHTVIFAGVLGMAEDQIISAGFDLINIRAKGFNPRSLIGMISFGWLMTLAVIRSFGIVRQIKPDKVIGFGGYGSFPILSAAWGLRYPIMIHEQNVFPGKANKLMARFAKIIAVSFKDSEHYFKGNKTVLTGCPCHSTKTAMGAGEIRKKFGLDPYKKTILLLGGSQGSQKLNGVMFDFMRYHHEGKTIQAIHMTGKNEYERYVESYKQEQLPVAVCAFISNIDEAYQAADVIIARAGASSVTEIGLLGLPAVLVPYPFAGGHQRYNAKVLERLGNAIIVEQEALTVDTLQQAVGKMSNAHLPRAVLQERIKGVLLPNAAIILADTLEHL